MRSIAIAAPLWVLAIAGCPGDPDRPEAAESDGQRFLLCGRIASDRESEDVEIGGLRLHRRGYEMSLEQGGDGRTRLGLLSGIEEWTEPNQANLDDLLSWFAAQRVEAIVVAGGIGSDRQTCASVLGRLVQSRLPVLSLIGASADFAGYRRAIAEVRRRESNLIDLSVVRLLRWDGVDIVSLPGYHNPFYLAHRRGGCAYTAADVRALRTLVRAARNPVLLVSSDAPRGRGRGALDFARGGANIGDPALADFLGTARVPFGVFGHVYEAGGRATTDVEGLHPAREGVWSGTLFVNPGAAEAVPYDMADGSRARGMGAIVEISGERARYLVHRVETAAARSREPNVDRSGTN